MTRTLVRVAILAWLCVLPAQAQSLGPFDVELGQLWMNVKGYDAHAGDVVRQTEVFTDPPDLVDTRLRTPIRLDMDAGNTFWTEVRYRRNGWGAGVRGWAFSSDDDTAGGVSSSEPSFTATTATIVTETVDLWNETLPPVVNELEDSEVSPVDYRAAGGLRTYTVDFFAWRELSESDDHRVLLVAGAKTGRLETDQSKGLTQKAFVFDFFGPGLHLNNFIELASSADADFLGVGPMIGLEADTEWRWLRVHTSASQALLIGDATMSGLFTDVDEITSTADPAGPFMSCTVDLVFQGCLPIESSVDFSTSRRVFLPATELRVSLRIGITRNIVVAGNAFAAIWGNAPVPPTFSVTHASSGPGQDWRQEERALLFGGVGVAVLVGR